MSSKGKVQTWIKITNDYNTRGVVRTNQTSKGELFCENG